MIVGRFVALVALVWTALGVAGCGVFTARQVDFDNAETGEDGQVYVLDDLEAIAADPDLSDEEKRDAFRELGIEDEDLMDGLLTL